MKRTALSALTVAAVTLLGGCITVGPPTGPPSVPTTAVPKVSPPQGGREPVAPVQAEPVRTADLPATPANAREFARQWIEAANLATTRNDTDALRVMSASGCAFCQAIEEAAQVRIARGSRIEGGELSITSIGSDLLVCRGGYCSTEIEVHATEQTAQHVMADGSVIPVTANPHLVLRLQILVERGQWWVVGVDASHEDVAPTEAPTL